MLDKLPLSLGFVRLEVERRQRRHDVGSRLR
jgi:hypothetical protein